MAVQYDSDSGWTTWLDVFKEKLPEVSSEANNFFNSYIKNGENLTQIINDFSQDGEFDGFIKGSKLADKTLISFLKDTKYATKDLESYKQYLQDAGTATST